MYKKIKSLFRSAKLNVLPLDGCEEPIDATWYDNKGEIHEGEVIEAGVDSDNDFYLVIEDEPNKTVTVYESEHTLSGDCLEKIYDKLSEFVKNKPAEKKTIIQLITKTLEEKGLLAETSYSVAISLLYNSISKATDKEIAELFPVWNPDLVRETADYLYNTLSEVVQDKQIEEKS